MARGSRCGDERGLGLAPTVGLFVRDDGGYTTVAMACALLVTLTLVFSAAAAEWTLARSSEVQRVADAAALAGANGVAAFSTVAQVLDACVLSLGLAGVLVHGAGLVVAAIPFVQAKAPAVTAAGRQLLEARHGLATTGAQGLQRLEAALPALVMANSASCVSANCRGGVSYVGCAVPFPQASETDWSYLDVGPDPAEMEESAERLREATARKEEALKRAAEAKERAWRADCVDAPLCMRSRARTLAGMTGASNPNYASPEAWMFEYARVRARNYYLLRRSQEAPEGSWPEELSRSAARKAFYAYAADAIGRATCVEGDHAHMDLPELPHTSAMVRATTLYTDTWWPCTDEEGGRTLHSTLACPAATGGASGLATLQQLEAGSVRRCETCGMDVTVMGNVADASTNIDNGFEHYWRIVVRESEAYVAARREAAAADEEMRREAERSSNLFQQAIDALSVERPALLPAGAWGCVALVVRAQGTSVPSELTAALSQGAELPPGAALAAATLAPDESTDGNTVLARAFDGLRGRWGAPIELVGNVAELWGRLLVGYGAGYDAASGAVRGLLDGVGSLMGEAVATWLRNKVSGIVGAIALQPADMRVRKPVLVATQDVLDKAGLPALGQARRLLSLLGSGPEAVAEAAWQRVLAELGSGGVTVAELPIPGSGGLTVPLTLDVGSLLGGAS